MASSGTYAFSPEIAEIVDEAFERAGVDPETVTGRHLRSARRSMAMIFSDWSNDGIKLWQVDLVTLPLVQGTATYNTSTGTQALLDVFLRNSDGIDTIVSPMARDEYAGTPDKSSEGFPSRYYFDRQRSTPTITLWQVPNNSTDTLVYYRMIQPQDVGSASNTPDVPFRWLEALTAALASRLAAKFNPDREQNLIPREIESYERARTEDRQRTPTRLRVNFR